MLGFLRRWFGRPKDDPVPYGMPGIFRFHDGRRVRAVDAVAVVRRLLANHRFDAKLLFAAAESLRGDCTRADKARLALNGVAEAAIKVVDAVCTELGVEPFQDDGEPRGMPLLERIELVKRFFAYMKSCQSSA